MFFTFEYVRFAGVGISCLAIDDEAFGLTFNIQLLALFEIPKPSNTCKVLREMLLDLKRAGEHGIYLPREEGDNKEIYLHKEFLSSIWADGVAR
jgi:hypothetical protein